MILTMSSTHSIYKTFKYCVFVVVDFVKNCRNIIDISRLGDSFVASSVGLFVAINESGESTCTGYDTELRSILL